MLPKRSSGSPVAYEKVCHSAPPLFGGGWGEASAACLLCALLIGHRRMADAA